jgi:hypothetical protein
MIGPGKYDHIATTARELTGATTTLILIINGNRGTGFSLQTIEPRVQDWLPTMLRKLADEIEAKGGDA